MTCPGSDSLLGDGDRSQSLSDPRAHSPSSGVAASLRMASLTLEGWPTRLQPPGATWPGHV